MNKLETKLYRWFDKRFTGGYFNLRLKERDKYLQSCARELDKAIKDSVKEWIIKKWIRKEE